MADHKFGGDWTEIKLSCLEGYLTSYRQIFTKNEKARFLRTWYEDAFAGSGSRADPSASAKPPTLFDDVYADAETSKYRDGSAKIALRLSEPFDNYLFIDKSKSRINELKETIEREHPSLLSRCDCQLGEANKVLQA